MPEPIGIEVVKALTDLPHGRQELEMYELVQPAKDLAKAQLHKNLPRVGIKRYIAHQERHKVGFLAMLQNTNDVALTLPWLPRIVQMTTQLMSE